MNKPRILIIDDEPDLARLLASAFAQSGFDAVAAENGAEGLDRFGEQRFDAVITDIIMPEREGFETIRDIRAISPAVVILAISGCGRLDPVQFRDIAIKLGADDFMSKPFRPSALIAAVRAKLDERANAVAV